MFTTAPHTLRMTCPHAKSRAEHARAWVYANYAINRAAPTCAAAVSRA